MGLQKNFIYNSIITTSNYIFPLIVFPYISRVLGVTNVGVFNFIDSVVNYFVVFSMMGLSTLGVREIAAVRTDKEKLDKVFSSLITLSGLFTVIALIALIASTYTVPKLYEHRQLMYIGAVKLVFNFLLIEWFYTGLEDFKYITKRTLLIKILYALSIFVFVRKQSHYNVYFTLTALVVVVNAIVNITKSRQYVHYNIRKVTLQKYIKPYILLGLYMILTTMYTTFNIVYLGFACTADEVGLFSTAYKLTLFFLAFYTAWSSVIMPRISSIYATGNEKEFRMLIGKSLSILLCFAIPLMVVGIIFSDDIILLLAGAEFAQAAVSLRIMFPLVFIVGYSQIMVIQILVPAHKDKQLTLISCIAAIIGIMLNAALTPYLKSTGTSITWFSAELSIMAMAQISTFKSFRQGFPFKQLSKNIIAYMPALLVCLVITYCFTTPNILRLALSSCFMVCYFVAIQYSYLKDVYLMSASSKFINGIFSKK